MGRFPRHEVVVRPRTESDLDQAASALVAVHQADGYPVEGVARPREWLTPSGVLGAWVAVVEGVVVGHAVVTAPAGEGAVKLWRRHSDDPTALGVLGRLFVAPSARKRAIGERLVRASMDYAVSRRMHLILDVMAKDVAAIRLYERLGWREIGRLTHNFGQGGSAEGVAYAWQRGVDS